MTTINTSDGNNQATGLSSEKTADITSTASSSLGESLSQEPLTLDQKIEKLTESQSKLTEQIRNLTLGLNHVIELSKIMMKNQIESSATLVNIDQSIQSLAQSLDTKLASIQPSLNKDIKNLSDTLLVAQEVSNKRIFANQSYVANALNQFANFLLSKIEPRETERISSIRDELDKVQ